MIPLGRHPLMRVAIATFFTAGFAYGSAVAAVERRWDDEVILLPVMLLCLFGLARSWAAAQVWIRSRSSRAPGK